MYIYIIYFFLIFIIGLLFKNNLKSGDKNYIILYSTIICSMLVFISGFRNSCVGIDTSMYQYIWEGYRPGVYRNLDVDSEYGFAYLMIFFRQFTNYTTFLLVVACLSILPVGYVVSKYSKNVCFSFLLFYSSILFHTLEFAAERQAIAFGGVILAFHFLMKRNLKAYILIMFLSFFFHRSSIIFFPCYWLYDLKLDKKTILIWIGILVGMFVFGSIVLTYLNSFWRQEYDVSEEEVGGARYFLLQCVIVALGFYKYKLFNNNYLIKVPFLIYSISVLLWPILRINPALFRLTYYFDFFVAIFIPNFIFALSAHKNLRRALIAISVFMMLYVVLMMRTVEAYYPYKFVWEF